MEYKEYQGIIYQPGRVTRIILNRPQYRNAISHPMYGEIEHAIDRFAADPACKVLVISGAGSCFSAGHDAFGLTPESAPMMADRRTPEQLIKDYGSEREVWRHYGEQHKYFLQEMHLHKFHRVYKPTIAMVHGYCVWGGFFLAGVMDIIFASEDALFLTEVGQCDPGTWDFGVRKMLEIVYEHRFLSAMECRDLHFVNRVYPDFKTLERETLAFANRVADNAELSFTSLTNIKKAVHHTRDLQGFTQACEDTWVIAPPGSRPKEEEKKGHGERVEGKGMARTPRALMNLKIKLESQGEPVPQALLDAIDRASKRDDKAAWHKALHQDWRDKDSIAKADAEAKKLEEEAKKKQQQ
ncbi:MAG: enoyl-CoA hydratase/isomerase family protein [Dehalococcoidales bacterium]|nr:enoyl-CoA hydratase/isomerase family protein [Dehalococcoidales bacterium]